MRGDRLVEGPILPLTLRGVLLVVGTVAVLLAGTAEPTSVLGTSLSLLVVLAAGALRLPPRMALLQAFGEATVVGLLIGSRPDLDPVFVPLLLLSVFTTGQRGGVLVGGSGGVVGTLAWSLGVMSNGPDLAQVADRLTTPLVWSALLVATGLIGGWLRRLTQQSRSYSDSAYDEAFRLLSALQEVSRNLSLGLDPTTLGRALLDEVGTLLPGSERRLSVRTGDGRLAPLAGTAEVRAGPDGVLERAWSSGEHVSHDYPDGHRHDAFPVRISSQVIAVLDIRAAEVSADRVEDVQRAVTANGPKLAAALIFDEVRQLATVDERLRLAREIHDGVAQEVASVGYLLDDLTHRVPDDAADELRSLREHVRRVTGELRLSIFDLRAGADDGIGLGTALGEHVQRVGQQSDLVVHTVLDEHGDRLSAGTEVELLRIAQEAVMNVRRHAQASNIWVECTVDAPRAWVRVADDGVGLQPARPQSMGIRGMRERARRVGGALTISERPGGGTVVEVTVGDWDEETE